MGHHHWKITEQSWNLYFLLCLNNICPNTLPKSILVMFLSKLDLLPYVLLVFRTSFDCLSLFETIKFWSNTKFDIHKILVLILICKIQILPLLEYPSLILCYQLTNKNTCRCLPCPDTIVNASSSVMWCVTDPITLVTDVGCHRVYQTTTGQHHISIGWI